MKRIFLFILLITVILGMNAKGGRGAVKQCRDAVVRLHDGGVIHYDAYGSGKPLILVHGHTLDHRMWEPQIKEFSRHFNVIVPDMRGYGRSSKMYDGINTTHVDDLIEFMDSLQIDKAHVLGLSMGGFITADMVAMYPDRILSAIMASGSLRNMPGPSTPLDSAEIAKAEASIHDVQEKGIKTWKDAWIEKLIGGGGSMAETIRPSLTEQVYEWDAWQLLHVEPRLYYAQEALPRLKERCPQFPVLFLSGENEHKKPAGMMRYLPNASFVVIDDCGHMSNMERPQQFNKIVLDFLLHIKNI